MDPQDHINTYEWKRTGYKYNRVWPHLFPSTLDDLPNKWYKIEEAWGDNFYMEIPQRNIIKDFSFNTQEKHL